MKRENFIDLQVSISKSIVCANNMIESSVIIVTFIKSFRTRIYKYII